MSPNLDLSAHNYVRRPPSTRPTQSQQSSLQRTLSAQGLTSYRWNSTPPTSRVKSMVQGWVEPTQRKGRLLAEVTGGQVTQESGALSQSVMGQLEVQMSCWGVREAWFTSQAQWLTSCVTISGLSPCAPSPHLQNESRNCLTSSGCGDKME